MRKKITFKVRIKDRIISLAIAGIVGYFIIWSIIESIKKQEPFSYVWIVVCIVWIIIFIRDLISKTKTDIFNVVKEEKWKQ